MNDKTMHEITMNEATELFDSEWWLEKTPAEIVQVQLFTARLCLPFHLFQGAVEKSLGRPVYTHEFAHPDLLQKEFLGEMPPPSMNDIIGLLPSDVIIVIPGETV